MRNPIAAYTHWLHTRWPAGTVEKLPEVRDDGSTRVPGLFVVGDLTGVPLLKFSADSGSRVVDSLAGESRFQKRSQQQGVRDLVIIGGGVSGFAAALRAQDKGLDFEILEASEPFSTIVNFPKAKPIYTYPTEMTPAGPLQFHEKSEVKEGLLDDLREQTLDRGVEPRPVRATRVARDGDHLRVELAEGEPIHAHAVVVAIGRSGNFRKLNVPGEDLDKVYNRLHDPADFCGQNLLVVGGGDSAMETAIALASCGAHVTLSYRKSEFSRPKPENQEKILALAENPEAAADIEHPSSERVSTAAGDFLDEDRKRRQTGSLKLLMASNVQRIEDDRVVVKDRDGEMQEIPNDAVFAMIGREPPLDFFRRSGVPIRGEWTWRTWAGMGAFILFMTWIYHWKSEKPFPFMDQFPAWLNPEPIAMFGWLSSLGGFFADRIADPETLLGTLRLSAVQGAFFYTLAYSLIVLFFGIARIRRRKTPYIKWQTTALIAIQVIPLFILPEIVLPLMGHHGLFGREKQVIPLNAEQGAAWRDAIQPTADGERSITAAAANLREAGAWPDVAEPWSVEGGYGSASPGWNVLVMQNRDGERLLYNDASRALYLTDPDAEKTALSGVADALFPVGDYGNGREYWRAYGLILAWPLFIHNWFTDTPLWAWIWIGVAQTFLLIPLGIYFFGKGVYCGWICSCGALAETLGDQHRHKMPHGPFWNRFNMVGQVFLLFALVLLAFRIALWVFPESGLSNWYEGMKKGWPLLNYEWFVDVLWAGILGYGVYFWLSGRFWCRFACPLAALMHIYTRFSTFRILSDKKKCISCNVCTSVCHQGIDVMNFANKGQPMADPECVRCSACVQSCPTGVLYFGRVNRKTGEKVATDPDWLAGSPVRMAEVTVNGRKPGDPGAGSGDGGAGTGWTPGRDQHGVAVSAGNT